MVRESVAWIAWIVCQKGGEEGRGRGKRGGEGGGREGGRGRGRECKAGTDQGLLRTVRQHGVEGQHALA